MAKNCLIYETLNEAKSMQVKTDGEFMTLSGVFGVCGVRNNNKRVYEASNYSKMVTEMQNRIKAEGSIPGELEHPQSMNMTLDNISHKITDIQIDENGTVTGSITLLNTPKGKLAQEIVKGGLPLYISSRAVGQVDSSTGNVTLEKIATYDLVGSPGFSQAKLHLNENQVAESINESSIFYITESGETNENNLNIENMDSKEIMETLEDLKSRLEAVEEENQELRDQIDEMAEAAEETKKVLCEGIQNWLINDYSPKVQEWIQEHFAEEFMDEVMENIDADEIKNDVLESFAEEIAPKIQDWVVEEFAPEVQKWVVEEYSPEVQNWCINEYAKGIQDWVLEQYAPSVESFIKESVMPKIQTNIAESIENSKSTSLSSIDSVLSVLENIKETKPTYQKKTLITENADEPVFVREMPAESRVKWDLASQEVKESITRRAKLYNFTTEGAVERFWESINFDNIKPTNNIFEGLDAIQDETEKNLRARIRMGRIHGRF